MAEWQVLWARAALFLSFKAAQKPPPLSLAFACLLFQTEISAKDHRGHRLVRGERGGAALVDAGHGGPRAGHAALRRLVDGGEPVRVGVPVFLHVLVLCAFVCVIAGVWYHASVEVHQISWGLKVDTPKLRKLVWRKGRIRFNNTCVNKHMSLARRANQF